MMNRESWDVFYVKLCELYATRSKDESTKLGCIITQGNTLVSAGYNCFPRGINDALSERQGRDIKYYYFSHAEANALSNALRNGTSVFGCTLYLPKWLPCADCSRLIIQSGIKEVVSPDFSIPDRWIDSSYHGMVMLTEAEVKVRNVDTELASNTTILKALDIRKKYLRGGELA